MYDSVAQIEMRKKKKYAKCQPLRPISHLSILFLQIPAPSHTPGERSGKINQQYFTDLTHSRASRRFGTYKYQINKIGGQNFH